MRRSICVLVALAFAGCAAEYVYTPESANAMQGGLPASRTAIPPEKPQGAVSIISQGIEPLTVNGQVVRTLHVRMVVTNDNDPTPWHVDARQQYLDIERMGRTPPLFVDSGGRPLDIVVKRLDRRDIDLYFPLPQSLSESQLPHFDVVWQVDTSARRIASRTSFNRIEPIPAVAYPYDPWWGWGWGGGWGWGWGGWGGWGWSRNPGWWYDPFYTGTYTRPGIERTAAVVGRR
ncbi:MAG: hypothetical protein KF773_37740 [Deltaproteobacteria bacterium]|nr:hypothetical protein [Deltaproteobacteria bacterium]MCW5802349.1 hypothetical protein [Deltaproteobacteria bacterium]